MKNILITGVSTGIGYDAVRHFLDQGYRVFGSVRKDNDKLRLESEFPSNFVCLQFDVVDVEKIKQAAEEVKTLLAGDSLTALVNNAGYALAGPMALLSDDAFRKQIEVNVFGVRTVTNAFLPLLGAQKNFNGKPGKVINISSISGIFNSPMNGAYCVTKHALESMAEVYRRELMIYGIQFSSIQPGPIQSKLWDKNDDTLDEYFDTEYGNMARNTAKIIDTAQQQAQPASVISNLIEKIINKKKPKLSYVVHSNKLQVFFLTRIFPSRMVDYLIFKSLNKSAKRD